jgi:DNA ligase-associated metallophosphoesterase
VYYNLAVEFEWHDRKWLARPDKSLLDIETRTLFVADLHLGKGNSFRAQGAAVPTGSTRATLDNLNQAVSSTSAASLVILGDLVHDRFASIKAVHDEISSAFTKLAISITWIEGNHDRKLAEQVQYGLTRTSGKTDWFGIELRHEPVMDARRPTLAGHLHPGITLAGRARQSVHLPCFWIMPNQIVLPAFGDFTGSSRIKPREGDELLLVAEGKVKAISAKQVLAIS